MLLIFIHSAMPGDMSGAESDFIVRLIRRFVDADPALLSVIVRKAAHFAEFALLGGCLAVNVNDYKRGPAGAATFSGFFMSLIIGTLYAVTDELHQSYVPDRVCAVKDVCIDAAGVAVGALLMICILRSRQRRRKKKTASDETYTGMKHAMREPEQDINAVIKGNRKKRRNNKKRKKQLKRLRVLLVLLIIAWAGAGVTIYRDYHARPGFLEKIWISDRSDDYITVAWERPRNVYKFVVKYNGKTINVSGRKKKVKITGLKADTYYRISVRADSREREGFEELREQARTKKSQTIEGEAEQIRFANRPVDLKQTAVTDIIYTPGKGYNVTEDGKVVFTEAGNITVTVKARESEEYGSATREIKVEVLDSVNTPAKGAKQHVFYKLNRGNCELIRSIKGTKKIYKPQGFVKKDGMYMVAFIYEDEQRIVTYGNKRSVYTPAEDLGHANGLTYAGGRYYSVAGWSGRCVSFDHPDGEYESFDLPYYASGIAYDELHDMFYTTSRKQLVVYDGSFNYIKSIGRVQRKNKFYAQDCAVYDGILMQAISGPDYDGINYIDFYDVNSDTYLGSIECNLSEVESVIVNDEGYLEILSNEKGRTERIWKTPFNIKKLCS